MFFERFPLEGVSLEKYRDSLELFFSRKSILGGAILGSNLRIREFRNFSPIKGLR